MSGKSYGRLGFTISVILFIGGMFMLPKKAMGADSKVAQLELSVPLQRRVYSDYVVCDVILRNTSPHPIWVNKRMLVNIETAPKVYRELSFTVRDPNGQDIPFECKLKTGMASATDHVVLAPDEIIRKEVILSDCYRFTAAGRYSVQAHYQDGSGFVPAQTIMIPQLDHLLDSNIVMIDVEPRDPGQTNKADIPDPQFQWLTTWVAALDAEPHWTAEIVAKTLGIHLKRDTADSDEFSDTYRSAGGNREIEVRLLKKRPGKGLIIWTLAKGTSISRKQMDGEWGKPAATVPPSLHASPGAATAYDQYQLKHTELRGGFQGMADSLVRVIVLESTESQ